MGSLGRPGAGRLSGIFICYRRNDSAPWAGRVYDSLVREWGEDLVFMDVDTIAPGEVIPVLVGGASMPKVAELPGPIKELAFRNAVVLEDRRASVATSGRCRRRSPASPCRRARCRRRTSCPSRGWRRRRKLRPPSSPGPTPNRLRAHGPDPLAKGRPTPSLPPTSHRLLRRPPRFPPLAGWRRTGCCWLRRRMPAERRVCVGDLARRGRLVR
jgi:hypothetical protein